MRISDWSSDVCSSDLIGPAPSKDSYLNIPAILSAATITGADAIHPGVGFLSENAGFASMVEEHGMVFIGPSPEHIAMMGGKVVATQTAQGLGLPVVPGPAGVLTSSEPARSTAGDTGYPALTKSDEHRGGHKW